MPHHFSTEPLDPFETEPQNDRALIANALLGDRIAARKLVDRLDPIIRGGIRKYVSADRTDDFVQEVWAHLCARNYHVLQTWTGEGPLINFVWIVTVNRVRDLLTKGEVPTDDIEPPDLPGDDDPERTVEIKQLRECVQRAKGRLSHMHQNIIHLRYDLGMMHREIAERLGRTLGYVGGTLARAERYLRDEIREACGDHLGRFTSIFDR